MAVPTDQPDNPYLNFPGAPQPIGTKPTTNLATGGSGMQSLQDILGGVGNDLNGGKPQMPAFQGITNPDGTLKSQYQLTEPGYSQSPWLAQELQQQSGQQTDALNRGAQQAATGAASAQASLATHGGLSSGAAERLANQSQEQRQLGAQDIYNQGNQQKLGININDAQQQRDYNTTLQQGNLQNMLGEVASKRQFDLGKYQEQMKGYAADKSAEATEKSAGGGISVICTALKDIGLISSDKHKLATKFRIKVTPEAYTAYLIWGVPVANAIRIVPTLGYLFRPLVRYWTGDRDLLAKAQFKFFFGFNKLFVRKKYALQK